MEELFALGLEIAEILFAGLGEKGDLFNIDEAGIEECTSFGRVIGEQADGGDLQILQNSGSGCIVSCVDGEAERQIGFYGVETPILQAIGADLVQKPNAAPLMAPQVDEKAYPFLFDERQAEGELLAAVASFRSKDIPCQTLGMDAD